MPRLTDLPHRRFNPLTREWLLVSPHRAERPWLGAVEEVAPEARPAYDPTCYLCPGNVRARGDRNPDYRATFAFDNDFAALIPPAPHDPFEGSALVRAEAAPGACRVLCFSPRHNLTLPEMAQAEVEAVVEAWIRETRDLSAKPFVGYVQVFENKGELMGASNPHPHSQIWATKDLPTEVAKEDAAQGEYLAASGGCLLCDYIAEERARGERLVASNQHFIAMVPFWAVWPFELLVVSSRHVEGLIGLSETERAALADIIRQVTIRYDNVFEVSFPYSMGFHQAPVGSSNRRGWHLHAHYYPPLLRSATVRKFMVGFEMLGMPQRDLPPEHAAERLRTVSARHYRASAGVA
ncbi:MAG: UDP-glucose--hexose-1-phosphate uridylyltransferase [Vicinamibacterales bacterium]